MNKNKKEEANIMSWLWLAYLFLIVAEVYQQHVLKSWLSFQHQTVDLV